MEAYQTFFTNAMQGSTTNAPINHIQASSNTEAYES